MENDRINIPSYLIEEVEEESNSDKVTFIMRGGIKFKAKKSDFKDYEKFKEAIKRHQHNRDRSKSN
jgi:hypothetical protein